MKQEISQCVMKIVSIVGARPQFIKLAPVSRAITQHNEAIGSSLSTHNSKLLTEVIIHTGQHYDYEMSKVFFEELQLKEPDHYLGVGSGTHAFQTGEMLKRLEEVLLREKPNIVMVFGDTNSTLAGALAATKLHIPVVHIESGVRSFSKTMPEEANRVLTDHMSSLLFCPTRAAVRNLWKEGFTSVLNNGMLITDVDLTQYTCSIDDPLVINVGDVMYDSMLHNQRIADTESRVLGKLGLADAAGNIKKYQLATIHREENVQDQEKLREIFLALQDIASAGIPVVCPLHPRTRKTLRILGDFKWDTNLHLIDPVSYIDMLMLEKHARLILTDSGGFRKRLASSTSLVSRYVMRRNGWKPWKEAGMCLQVPIEKRLSMLRSGKLLGSVIL